MEQATAAQETPSGQKVATLTVTVILLIASACLNCWQAIQIAHLHSVMAIRHVIANAMLRDDVSRIPPHERRAPTTLKAWQWIEKIDASKCPMDFQKAWTAFIGEAEQNAENRVAFQRHEIIDVAGILFAPEAATGFGTDALKTAANAPVQETEAMTQLKVVLLEYKN